MRSLRILAVVLPAALLLAAFLYASTAVAKGTHLKLKGVVVGTTTIPTTPCGFNVRGVKISVHQGSKKVGTMSVSQGCVGGLTDEQDGTANLTVGKVKGKAHVQLTFHGTGNILNFKQPKFGTGHVFTRKIKEKIRVNGKHVPQTVGATFTFELSY